MSGVPWHPILAHFPIVLSVFLPVLALAYWTAGRRSGNRGRFWAGLAVFHALVFGSGFLAMQAGEADEERVEKVLASEEPLEAHEFKGELFVQVSGGALLPAFLGLAPGAAGLIGRILAGLASVAILWVGVLAGHTGGQLVYRHGAAAAFLGERAAPGFEGAAGREGAHPAEESPGPPVPQEKGSD